MYNDGRIFIIHTQKESWCFKYQFFPIELEAGPSQDQEYPNERSLE